MNPSPNPKQNSALTPQALQAGISATAFAFRGYNIANLGRSTELLAHPKYGATFAQHVNEISKAGSEILNRELDLVDRIRNSRDTTLAEYADAVVLLVAVELAQLQLLREFFEIEYEHSRMAMGYSLGEITALIASRVFPAPAALEPPLLLADDCIALAEGVILGVAFTRAKQLPFDEVQRQCQIVSQEGAGVIGVSAILSPNSVIVMGQSDTLDRFAKRINKQVSDRVYLRRNSNQWPPMHTPIVWQRNIPNRCALHMQTMDGGFTAPNPPVLSMVTGDLSYNDFNARELLQRWVDHPQRLWDAVYATLDKGIETIIHVGPTPNIIPATFSRLSENVAAQIEGSMGIRAMSNIVGRPWLKSLLPARTALLRAPLVNQVILEDWLLEQKI